MKMDIPMADPCDICGVKAARETGVCERCAKNDPGKVTVSVPDEESVGGWHVGKIPAIKK